MCYLGLGSSCLVLSGGACYTFSRISAVVIVIDRDRGRSKCNRIEPICGTIVEKILSYNMSNRRLKNCAPHYRSHPIGTKMMDGGGGSKILV